MLRSLLPCLCLLLPTPFVLAKDSAQIAQEALRRLAPEAEVKSVRDAALPGFLEVQVPGEILYLSKDGRYLLQGTLVDTISRVNITEQSREKQRVERISGLSDAGKISFESEDAAHRVTVFTALDCGYCRRMHAGIQDYLDAGISIDYVLIPLGGDQSQADVSSRAIHCAADRQDLLTQAMRGTQVPPAHCPAPGYVEGKALAMELGIRQTPTVVDDAGRRVGLTDPATLRKSLDAVAAAR